MAGIVLLLPAIRRARAADRLRAALISDHHRAGARVGVPPKGVQPLGAGQRIAAGLKLGFGTGCALPEWWSWNLIGSRPRKAERPRL
jgi:hypothetical protein